ncbi:hypothetical protein DEO72_LG7g1128 [Vigna unguiculata]|uniref:Uncharacterized protein n=1 Tax=Vigna unguiculata TaxID=3917 RepID=A0A4D6MEG8_VIGUN|nr:hypothetical protein DEO72_LG7g1128 [Vigna unguiculata]
MVVVAVAVELTGCEFEGGRDVSRSLSQAWRRRSEHDSSHGEGDGWRMYGGCQAHGAMEAQWGLDDGAGVAGLSSWSATVASAGSTSGATMADFRQRRRWRCRAKRWLARRRQVDEGVVTAGVGAAAAVAAGWNRKREKERFGVGVEEREREIRVRVCVGKERITWQH